MTGWNLPPGVTSRMIEDLFTGECEVCARSLEECICPECPTCGLNGNPDCYAPQGHGMRRNKHQLIAKSRANVQSWEMDIHTEKQYISWLNERPDGWREGDLE